MSPPRSRPDIQVVRRVAAILVATFVLAMITVLPSPPEEASAVPAEEDYELHAVTSQAPDLEAPVAVGEDVPQPTRHLARVAEVEVHPPAAGATVPAATLEVAIELRHGERTNLRPRAPEVLARLDDGRLFRAEPCPGDGWPQGPEVTEEQPWRERVCVRVPTATVDHGLRLELRANLADDSEELAWHVDPQLEPL